MKITLPDGSIREYEQEEIRAIDLAYDISPGLGREACAVTINGVDKDIRTVINEDSEVTIHKFDSKQGKEAFWHTTAHVMAQAIKRIYPETKISIGPPIENGFYYDLDREGGFGDTEIEKIEAEMKNIIKEGFELDYFELSREEALKLMEEREEPYKIELINDIPEGDTISFYKQGEFVDLCHGPHIMTVKPIKAFKLTSVAGAYWRGNENNKMLTRIYGISFPKKSRLDEYLEMLEEAKRRDHRKIGKELGLFMFLEESPGMPFYLPNGTILRNQLIEYIRGLLVKNNYHEIITPIFMNRALWERSGHWDKYQDKMFISEADDDIYAIKPMNCPGCVLVYNSQPHSYRDLPLRISEFGLDHRFEQSGELHGLMRVREFTQDDAHIFLTLDQIKDEIKNLVALVDEVYSKFGFTYHIELSTRPENSIGSEEEWNSAEAALQEACDELELNYVINPGDGAFYGPKLDFHLRDSLNRTWQCGTVQLDFQLPQRFEVEYVGSDGEKHRPVMIHRAILGSFERFIGTITEHFAGKFPTWLAPQQVRILPITDRHNEYGNKLKSELEDCGVRVHLDDRNEKVGYKIREAQADKVPYMLIIGDQEQESGTVSLRLRDHTANETLEFNDFKDKLVEEIKNKTMDSSFL
ncbi:threonine--tRNA ligase [Fastidiosipila sanguinis]|uniref:Threonine--tRNA ligase n=1 Tax=Fastidiosipila sanguinis TaxID=236753 RepID=A0A2S0KLB7_9FIRM|nr:threonine--tRNA ligase [Fastidiosipila sanguinis]AVM41830.1 threonine--tRNA ligase [Fastidiosipila sanguinis]